MTLEQLYEMREKIVEKTIFLINESNDIVTEVQTLLNLQTHCTKEIEATRLVHFCQTGEFPG